MRSYITAEVLLTTKRVELIGKKEFADAAMDLGDETFVVHVASLQVDSIQTTRRAQLASLLADGAPTTIPSEYAEFADILSPDNAAKLPNHTDINDHPIDLFEGQ